MFQKTLNECFFFNVTGRTFVRNTERTLRERSLLHLLAQNVSYEEGSSIGLSWRESTRAECV